MLRFLEEDDAPVAQEDKESGLLLLPGDVADDWNQAVASIVKDRVVAVPKMAQIEIFCCLASQKNTNEYLANIFMTEAAKALNEVVFDPVSYSYSCMMFVSNVTTVLFAEGSL